jgi:glucokinase
MNENRAHVNTAIDSSLLVRPMILAGDVGGTKTLLGLYDARRPRPQVRVTREFPTAAHASLASTIGVFLDAAQVPDGAVSAACFGVAGPVLGDRAELTNVAFTIDAPAIAQSFRIPHVRLLNDLEAMAYAVPVLEEDDLHVLQQGDRNGRGNMALIAAGTGLGQALLHKVGDGYIPSPTEAGHADWAARSERDVTVLRMLTSLYGRAEVEHVVSGRGIPNIHRAVHAGPCDAGIDRDDPGAPAAITQAALEGRCPMCSETVELFVDAYGAEAGNLALRSMATGGLFIGGGIAPKILPALSDGRFMRAFLDKAPMHELVARVPVKVILNGDAGLLGAAVFASTL